MAIGVRQQNQIAGEPVLLYNPHNQAIRAKYMPDISNFFCIEAAQSRFSKPIINFLVLTAIVTLVCGVNVALPQQYVTDGLIGFWTMDEEDIQGGAVKDVSGNGNDGKIVGGVEIAAGKIEEALHFNGTDSFVDLPDMGKEAKVSVEVWAKGEKFNQYNGLVAQHQWAAGCIHFKVEHDGTAHKIMVIMSGIARVWGPEIDTNKWYHFAYTSDTEKDELKLYSNGEMVQQGNTGAVANDLTDLTIGDEYTDPRIFTGILDEARIYKRILSEDEIQQNYKVNSNSLAVAPAGKLSTCWGKIKTAK